MTSINLRMLWALTLQMMMSTLAPKHACEKYAFIHFVELFSPASSRSIPSCNPQQQYVPWCNMNIMPHHVPPLAWSWSQALAAIPLWQHITLLAAESNPSHLVLWPKLLQATNDNRKNVMLKQMPLDLTTQLIPHPHIKWHRGAHNWWENDSRYNVFWSLSLCWLLSSFQGHLAPSLFIHAPPALLFTVQPLNCDSQCSSLLLHSWTFYLLSVPPSLDVNTLLWNLCNIDMVLLHHKCNKCI